MTFYENNYEEPGVTIPDVCLLSSKLAKKRTMKLQ